MLNRKDEENEDAKYDTVDLHNRTVTETLSTLDNLGKNPQKLSWGA